MRWTSSSSGVRVSSSAAGRHTIARSLTSVAQAVAWSLHYAVELGLACVVILSCLFLDAMRCHLNFGVARLYLDVTNDLSLRQNHQQCDTRKNNTGRLRKLSVFWCYDALHAIDMQRYYSLLHFLSLSMRCSNTHNTLAGEG